jgi:hypothetical protein
VADAGPEVPLMAAPIIVALDREYAEQVWRHLNGDIYLDQDVDLLLDAMKAAAVAKDLQTGLFEQADLFGERPL